MVCVVEARYPLIIQGCKEINVGLVRTGGQANLATHPLRQPHKNLDNIM
jgi:hypothetical protein